MGMRNTISDPRSEFESHRNLLVLFAATIAIVFGIGLPFSLGVLYEALGKQYGDSKQLLASVATTCAGTSSISGIGVAFFCQRFGTHMTMATGGVLVTFGMLGSFFATNVYYLIVSVGVITGLGCGFLVISGPVVIVDHFDRSRNLAVGIITAGGGVGVFIFQQFHEYSIDVYGWRGSLLLMAGLCLHIFIGVMIIILFRNQNTPQKQSSVICSAKMFKDARFFVWMICVFLIASSYTLPVVFLVDYAQDKNMSTTTGVWFISVFSLTSIPGRFMFGAVVQRDRRIVTIFAVAIILLFGSSLIMYAYIENSIHGYLVSTLSGFMLGAIKCSFPVVSLSLSDPDRFSIYFGLTSMMEGLGNFVCGPTLGYVRDVTGGYQTPFIAGGVVTLCAGTILGIGETVYCLRKRITVDDLPNM